MANVSRSKLRQSISDILDGADLTALSAKKVRKQLESEYGADLTNRKKEIDKLLMQMIEEREKKDENGEDESASEQSESDSADEIEPEPPKKKAKTKAVKKKPVKPKTEITAAEVDSLSETEEMDDEALAKKLQEEEHGRRSRHRSVKKLPAPKTKKKTERKNSGNSVYAKKCVLSPDLAKVLGTDQMARKDVVKKMWEIIKERKLQDPKNKQFMLCDDQLVRIFGSKRVRTFGMLKYLKSHMKDVADICT